MNDMSRTIDLAVTAIRGADPARFADPTPCPGFTVAALIDHMASGMLLAENSARRVVRPWDPGSSPVLGGVAHEEWAKACAAQATSTAAAWDDPAAWEGEAHMAETPMPAAMIGSLMTAEFALHAWDLAVATGQRLDVPDDLGRVVLDGVGPVAQMGRDGGWYGPEVPLEDGASAWERALSASGRDPRKG
ncbi:TIGR03086 family protein [Pseudonocardia sp. KRD-184]|uniref:TIGR03086 family protein n=1 Tax=Pseudonocardia oceani TaxID=2792013 RepID=A0ABS6U500_9PSEU|nr:TIGR03086 family metal-binding protein [Pseudonocardia oceani]MBW0091293.1 TIGR03086 family protein [Pseudonocardia oceani]MBW0097365.1 TIGR03086 family protein [Pseudonocardia oceani]MBW0110486.1 TIGR03086 family protein [Pseudonocardia oceani]MBW0124577.1 TIGR03086 family protein [Pseudonocardia oceani]MBW0127297.1 TIGR03086 family protein [Pseudonocardia oceani]